jgi:hypothetical protein
MLRQELDDVKACYINTCLIVVKKNKVNDESYTRRIYSFLLRMKEA